MIRWHAHTPDQALQGAAGHGNASRAAGQVALLPGKEELSAVRVGQQIIPSAPALPVVGINYQRQVVGQATGSQRGQPAVAFGLEQVQQIGAFGQGRPQQGLALGEHPKRAGRTC